MFKSTVAANLVSKSATSNFSKGFAPLLPFKILSQESMTLFPTGESMPRPVITTLLSAMEKPKFVFYELLFM